MKDRTTRPARGLLNVTVIGEAADDSPGVLVYHQQMPDRRQSISTVVARFSVYATVIAMLWLQPLRVLSAERPTAALPEAELLDIRTGSGSEDSSDSEISIDNAHKSASELLNEFASQIDNYFGEEVTTDVVNDTHATVRMDFSDQGDGEFKSTAKLKLRLVLPRSQQRMRLLLDVDEKEDDDDTPTVESLAEDDTNRAFSFAFRFMREISDKTRYNVDLGARRFDQRFQTFARLRVSSKNEKPEGWSFKLNNDLRQYYSSGYANRTSFDFWHSINNDQDTIFRSSTSFNWQKVQSGARIDQSIGIYKKLQQRSLLAFEVLAGYNTSPVDERDHYEGHTARIRYRKNIYRPWLHYEVWPSVSWLAENNGELSLGGLLRMEVQFGKYQ